MTGFVRVPYLCYVPVLVDEQVVDESEVELHHPAHQGPHTRAQGQPVAQVQAWGRGSVFFLQSKKN